MTRHDPNSLDGPRAAKRRADQAGGPATHQASALEKSWGSFDFGHLVTNHRMLEYTCVELYRYKINNDDNNCK